MQIYMACTVFCECQGGHQCYNEKTKEHLQKQTNEDEDTEQGEEEENVDDE